MLNSLDPHSSYSPAKQAKSMMESLQGSFEGIGVQFNMDRDTLLVIQTITNGPSEKVGILAGDRIVSVNDTAIAGVKMSREEIMHRLRGKKGTQVKLGVVRRGISGVLTFNVIRSAREGVERLGMLLEQYGTYESNGIAFSDKDEIWWMETIGGHHWIACRVPDAGTSRQPASRICLPEARKFTPAASPVTVVVENLQSG